MKNTIYILSLLSLLFSCQFLEDYKTGLEDEDSGKVKLASVSETNLYFEDIKSLVPKNLPAKDSIVFVKGLVNSWAKQQIIFQKAEQNISEIENEEVNSLVAKYRQSLYVNRYKERLILQELDTIVTQEHIKTFYDTNKNNLKLTTDILKIKYIIARKNVFNKKNIIKKFKSGKQEDLDDLESNLINFEDYRLNNIKWVSYDEVLAKISVFRKEKRRDMLNISKFIQKEDSLRVYLVAINDVHKKNNVAPIEYVESKIKELIIHRRKFELIREIEKTLLNDAIKNNTFKEFN